MKDEKLLEKLKSDPDHGMKALIDRYSGIVYSVVRARLYRGAFSEADIEDCVADTFSEFYLGLDGYDPARCGIKAWLCTIARNNAFDMLRKKRREAFTFPIDADDAPDVADSFSLEGDFIDMEERRAVAEAVLALGDPDREILMRKYYLGQSSKEIAERLKMTVSNVDTRAHRAVGRLKEMFGGEEQ